MPILLHGATKLQIKFDIYKYVNQKIIGEVLSNYRARAAVFNGLPEMPMKNVVIEDSRFRADQGFALNNVDGLTMKNVVVDVPGEKIIYGDGVSNVKVD